MAVVTEQMSSKGVLWIVGNLHDDCGQGNTWLDTPAKSVKEHLSIVICEHVGSGKRTATRRLLFEQGCIPEFKRDELTGEFILRACLLHGGRERWTFLGGLVLSP